jgi:hypothetical protein
LQSEKLTRNSSIRTSGLAHIPNGLIDAGVVIFELLGLP